MFTPNTIKSIVRSLTPLLYAAVAAVIAHFGYHVSDATVVKILGVGYGALAVVLHGLEARFPWVGTLLGWFGAPVYAPSVKKQQAATIAQLKSQVDALTAQKEAPVADGSPATTNQVA